MLSFGYSVNGPTVARQRGCCDILTFSWAALPPKGLDGLAAQRLRILAVCRRGQGAAGLRADEQPPTGEGLHPNDEGNQPQDEAKTLHHVRMSGHGLCEVFIQQH